jgi:hypothetical protein
VHAWTCAHRRRSRGGMTQSSSGAGPLREQRAAPLAGRRRQQPQLPETDPSSTHPPDTTGAGSPVPAPLCFKMATAFHWPPDSGYRHPNHPSRCHGRRRRSVPSGDGACVVGRSAATLLGGAPFDIQARMSSKRTSLMVPGAPVAASRRVNRSRCVRRSSPIATLRRVTYSAQERRCALGTGAVSSSPT